MDLKVEVGLGPLEVVVWDVEGTEEVLADLVAGEKMFGCFHLTLSFVWSVYVKSGIFAFMQNCYFSEDEAWV